MFTSLQHKNISQVRTLNLYYNLYHEVCKVHERYVLQIVIKVK